MTRVPPPIRFRHSPAALFFALCFCVYSITMSEHWLGYEAETIDQARSLLRGERFHGRAGILDVLFYLPWTALSEAAKALGVLPVFQSLLPNFAQPMVVAAAAAMVFGAASELYDRRAALAVALAFAFATMAWPYAKLGMETGLTLASALATWGWIRAAEGRAGRSGWIMLAAGCALLPLTKVQGPMVAALCAAAGVLLARRLPPERRPDRRTLGIMLALLAAGAALFMGANLWRYDRLFLSTSYNLKWEAAPPASYGLNLLGYFVSPGKSLFIFNPPLLASLALMAAAARKRPWLAEGIAVVAIPQILFHAYFRTWADETWGPRRLLNLLPLLILPLGEAFGRTAPSPARRSLLRPFALAAISAGIPMQIVAVSVSYASYSFALKNAGLCAQRNLIWSGRLPAWRFHAALLGSWASRAAGGPSGTIQAPAAALSLDPEDYLPWNFPEDPGAVPVPPPGGDAVVSLAEYDATLDFWWAERFAKFPNRPAYADKAFYLLLLLAAGAMTSGGALWAAVRMREEPPA